MSSFTLNINSNEIVVDVESDTPLLWVLRDTLELTGTKFGCGKGLCGACTVHLDGEAIKSCTTPVSAVSGKAVVTIEGLTSEIGRSLKQAWLEENVPQCGYCQPGQIMTAAALLAQNSNPSEDDINAAMADNLCRCGTYLRIRRAILLAAGEKVAGNTTEKDFLGKVTTSNKNISGLSTLAGAFALAQVGGKMKMDRRGFLKVAAMAGGGMIIGIYLPGCKNTPTIENEPISSITETPLPIPSSPTQTATATDLPEAVVNTPAPPPQPTAVSLPTSSPTSMPPTATPTPMPTATPQPTAWFAPNIYLSIDNNSVVTITAYRSEMGQGVRTAFAMIVAEELDADWSKVSVNQAPADPRFGIQDTHGSLSMIECYDTLRYAGAAARLMLVRAAAQIWGVSPESCQTENGMVIHSESNQSVSYGELVDAAAALPVPYNSEISLKSPDQYRIIGHRQRGKDHPEIVNGRAPYGIDVQLPDMVYATVVRCPVFSGRVASFDATKAEAIEGVSHVFQINSGIAVVANSTWAALKGREALEITWDEGGNSYLNSATIQQWFDERTALSYLNSGGNYLEAVYGMPFLAHTTMSPMNCVAHVGPDFCEVWAPTQRPKTAKDTARQYSGLLDSQITVHVTLLGGGFGRRREADFVAEAVQIAKVMGVPVKLIWTREDDIQHDFYHPLSYQHITTRTDTPGHYNIQASQNMPGVPNAAWRSASNLTPAFMKECFIDEVAAIRGEDPYELRMSLVEYANLKQVLETAATQANWGSPLPDGWGRGIAAYSVWGDLGYRPASQVAEVVEVEVLPDRNIRVHRVVCAIECGQVINPDTIEAQMEGGIAYGLTAAMKGEITIEYGRVQQSNFHDYPMIRMDEMPFVEVHIIPSDRAPSGVGEMSVPPIIPAFLNAVYHATGKRIRRLPLWKEDLI